MPEDPTPLWQLIADDLKGLARRPARPRADDPLTSAYRQALHVCLDLRQAILDRLPAGPVPATAPQQPPPLGPDLRDWWPLLRGRLSVRGRNAILRSGARTVADLETLTRERLLELPNCGERTVAEIAAVFRSLGIDDSLLQRAAYAEEAA
jgi:hypothetical protein